MLSGEGNAGERWKTKQLVLLAKKQLCTCSTLYCTFLCRCLARLGPHDYNVKLPETSLEEMFLFTFFHYRSFSPCIWLVAASISHFVTAATRFSCTLFFQHKMSPLFFISRSRSLSPFFTLSFPGLLPSFSFSLSFSGSIFQICGHDN